MTITGQIRQKLKTVDEELQFIPRAFEQGNHAYAIQSIKRARRILREICELDGESEE